MHACMQVSASEVVWCLAVPSGWPEGVKASMRRAALAAGMVDSVSSPDLTVLHEAEAASLYAHTDAVVDTHLGGWLDG